MITLAFSDYTVFFSNEKGNMKDTVIISAITGITFHFLVKNRNKRWIFGKREEKKPLDMSRETHIDIESHGTETFW